MSNPVYPENALPDDDPNPEGEDVDPDLVAVDEQDEQGFGQSEDQDEADFEGSEFL